MVGSFWSNSHFGKRSGAPVMTIFVFYVGPHFPDIAYVEVYVAISEYMKVFESIWRSTRPGRYLIFFLVKFHVECRQNNVWGCICDPSYDHIYKDMYFAKVKSDDNHG